MGTTSKPARMIKRGLLANKPLLAWCEELLCFVSVRTVVVAGQEEALEQGKLQENQPAIVMIT